MAENVSGDMSKHTTWNASFNCCKKIKEIIQPGKGIVIGYTLDEPWKHYANSKNQTQKTTYYMLYSRTGKSIETESRLSDY